MKIVKTTKSRDAETRSPQKSGIESKAKEDRLSVLYENAKSLAIDDVIELIYHPTENSDDDKVTVKHPYPEKKPLKPVLRKSANRKLYSIAIQHGRKHEKERRKSMAWLEPVLSKLNFDVFFCCFFVVRFAQEHDIPIPSFEDDKSVPDIQCPDLDLVVVCKNIFCLNVDEVKEEFSHVQGKREFVSTCYSLLNQDKLDDEEDNEEAKEEDDEETAELNGISHGSTDSKQEEQAEEEEEEEQDTVSKLAAKLVRQPRPTGVGKRKKVSPRKEVKGMTKVPKKPKKRKRDDPDDPDLDTECPPIDLAQFASLQFLSAEQDEAEKWDLMSLDRDIKALASRLGGPFMVVPRDRGNPARIRVFQKTTELGWMDMERLMTLYEKVKHTIEATRQLHGVTV